MHYLFGDTIFKMDIMMIQTDHDYIMPATIHVLSEFKQEAISYISGYVVDMAKKTGMPNMFRCSWV